MAKDPFPPVYCLKCKEYLGTPLRGAAIACHKCRVWSVYDNGKK